MIKLNFIQPSVTSSLGGSRGVHLDKSTDYNHQSNHSDTLGSLSTALHKGKSMPSLRWDCEPYKPDPTYQYERTAVVTKRREGVFQLDPFNNY